MLVTVVVIARPCLPPTSEAGCVIHPSDVEIGNGPLANVYQITTRARRHRERMKTAKSSNLFGWQKSKCKDKTLQEE